MVSQRKGWKGREGLIKYELIFDISSCMSKRYAKKRRCREFPSLNAKGVISLPVWKEPFRDNTLDYELLKSALSHTTGTTSTIKLVDDTFKSKGFMSWTRKEQDQ